MSKNIQAITPLEHITVVTLFICIRYVLFRIPAGTLVTLTQDFRDFL
jgi:hypothetical protein